MLDWEQVRTRANVDGEFRIHARFWNSRIRLKIGDKRYQMVVDSGEMMNVPVTLARTLGLDRPVYMGSSIGGHLAVDLAIHHAADFRALIGLETAAYTPGGFNDEFYPVLDEILR